MGSDGQVVTFKMTGTLFQSTLPAWGATFSGEENITSKSISIHAPRMGSDFVMQTSKIFESGFQSTLPAWGATSYAQ